MTGLPYELLLAESAELDMIEILGWSEAEFGLRAARRYEVLLDQVLNDVASDPKRPGAKVLSKGIYAYHLSFSRNHVAGLKVGSPRHFVLCRVESQVVEVLRILHDSRDLTRHLPETFLS